MTAALTPHSLGIDVHTPSAQRLVVTLARHPATLTVRFGGTYNEDPAYAQVLVRTTMTEDELDDWLYTTAHKNRIDYVGVFTTRATYTGA